MTYEFQITKDNSSLPNRLVLGNEYSLYYSNEAYLTEVESKNGKLICFGYCFDIRKPSKKTEDTLYSILMDSSLHNGITFLNGHFVLIYIKDSEIYIMCDATSLTPIHINNDYTDINNLSSSSSTQIFNPNLILNLTSKTLKRINIEIEENVEWKDTVLNLVQKQYTFFSDKNLYLCYKSNNYIKALVAILKPALYENYLLLNNSSNIKVDRYFGEQIAKDFSLIFTEEPVVLDSPFYLRNQLSNFSNFKKEKKKNTKLIIDKEFKNLNKQEQNIEMNILSRKRSNAIELSKDGLLYEPFNSLVIIKILSQEKNTSSIIQHIIRELLPSINYYDFLNSKTLKDINTELENKVENLKLKQITADNEQFLLDTKLTFFSVTNNLDGKIKKDEILVYPAKQDIKKDEIFNVTYEYPGEGMILVKSFFKHEQNGSNIDVLINGEKFKINELHEGILFNVQSKLNLNMTYKKDKKSLPWQKAGTLLIKKK